MASSMWTVTATYRQILPQIFRQCPLYMYSTKVDTSVEQSDVLYPPILPTGDERKYLRSMEKIKNSPTVPEMIYLLQKKQCWNVQMKPACFHPNFLPVYKHATKTHMVEGLPDYVQDSINTEKINQIASSVKESVENFVLQEMVFSYRHHTENFFLREFSKARSFLQNLVNHFLSTEIGHCPHILSGEFDYDVPMKSFWEREETRYQYRGKPLFILRTKEPLAEFTSRDSDLSVGEVEPYIYKPQWYSIFKVHHNSICFPGYKYGHPVNNGHTQIYLSKYNRKRVLETGQAFHDEVLQGHGLMSSFGWMAAMTMYQKHYWDDDLTRPLTCNTIVTDGKNFSFFCYQMNTIALHSRVSDTNNLRNVCWYTKDAPLYEELKDNGEVFNFNLEVLKTLISMLMMPPGNQMMERGRSHQKIID